MDDWRGLLRQAYCELHRKARMTRESSFYSAVRDALFGLTNVSGKVFDLYSAVELLKCKTIGEYDQAKGLARRNAGRFARANLLEVIFRVRY